MAETYDIITEEGGRLLTCVHDEGNILFKGKEGNLSLQGLMEQAMNPSLAKQRKNRKPKARRKPGTGINSI